jgi:nitrogenase molybdenum-cofactor synthesis protein NifE
MENIQNNNPKSLSKSHSSLQNTPKTGTDEINIDVPDSVIDTLKARKKHMCIKKGDDSSPACNKASIPGTVTQRSCVYGGARVVLMPITDAIHLVHGPIGCASCTWDIRGSRSSGDDLYKSGFSTNLQEKDIVFGGEKKLLETIIELNQLYSPAAIFVYSTCVVGLIGDDLKSVARKAEKLTKCRIIPVQSEGFRAVNKSLGHQLACDAMLDYLIGTEESENTTRYDMNIVGEFNVAGDLWGIKPLFEKIGVNILCAITGDSKVKDIAAAHKAKLNVVQCQKSSNYLAMEMEEKYEIPFLKVNFFGVEETANSLREVAEFFNDPEMIKKTEELVETELERLKAEISKYKEKLTGKRVAVYVGGNKAWSLIRAFEELEMEVIMTGTQNGLPEDYERIKETVKDGTLVVDDANSMELARLLKRYRPDLIVSGAKEKYLSLKLGIPFCDFNHDRITSFAGFQGFVNFAKEVDRAVSSPVWNLTPKKYRGIKENAR